MTQPGRRKSLILSANILVRVGLMTILSARSGRQPSSIGGLGPSAKSAARPGNKPTISLPVKNTNVSAESDRIAEGMVQEGTYSFPNESLSWSLLTVPRAHFVTHASGAYSLNNGSLPYLLYIVSRNHSETCAPMAYSRSTPRSEHP